MRTTRILVTALLLAIPSLPIVAADPLPCDLSQDPTPCKSIVPWARGQAQPFVDDALGLVAEAYAAANDLATYGHSFVDWARNPHCTYNPSTHEATCDTLPRM